MPGERADPRRETPGAGRGETGGRDPGHRRLGPRADARAADPAEGAAGRAGRRSGGVVITDVQRLRNEKAWRTRHYGADHPGTVEAGRALAVARLAAVLGALDRSLPTHGEDPR